MYLREAMVVEWGGTRSCLDDRGVYGRVDGIRRHPGLCHRAA